MKTRIRVTFPVSLLEMSVTLIRESSFWIDCDWLAPGFLVLRRAGASSSSGEHVKLASSPSLTLSMSGVSDTSGILSAAVCVNVNVGEDALEQLLSQMAKHVCYYCDLPKVVRTKGLNTQLAKFTHGYI